MNENYEKSCTTRGPIVLLLQQQLTVHLNESVKSDSGHCFTLPCNALPSRMWRMLKKEDPDRVILPPNHAYRTADQKHPNYVASTSTQHNNLNPLMSPNVTVTVPVTQRPPLL